MSGRKGTRALELWCKRLVKDCPEIQIDNMTTSWRNGMAFCALVHHFRPDLIDMLSLNPESVYENNKLAFTIAEKHLGIPALLDPEDMVANEVPDRLSVLTYLSQFYQRLGHTVNTKANESDVSLSPLTPASSSTPQASEAIQFGKGNLDKCVSCEQPVYLAQRLIVAQKLYHRRCFRCCKCLGHLDPNKMDNISQTELICDNCKSERPVMRKHEDQMGMLAFPDECDSQDEHKQSKSDVSVRRPLSVLERINIFESEALHTKLDKIKLDEPSPKLDKDGSQNVLFCDRVTSNINCKLTEKTDYRDTLESDIMRKVDTVNKVDKQSNDLNEETITDYKSDSKKFSFLQTQLSDQNGFDKVDVCDSVANASDSGLALDATPEEIMNDLNITDDSRLADSSVPRIEISHDAIDNKESELINIHVPPPRRKKQKDIITKDSDVESSSKNDKQIIKEYPDHLNPFSDDEEDEEPVNYKKTESTNPFGSSDEEEEDEEYTENSQQNIYTTSANLDKSTKENVKPVNPFWSDGEEPSSDEECHDNKMYKSSIAASTPNLQCSTPRRVKPRAPPPPRVASLVQTLHAEMPATSNDDIASLSSMSSYNSTIYSEKSCGRLTPRKTKRKAPTPPDCMSMASVSSRDVTATPDKTSDISGTWRNGGSGGGGGGTTKRPAPGLPLPARRQVRPSLPPGELQLQLDLLETQQLGLERQGVLIEQMIRDKCEGEQPTNVPQEEVEDLVIQLCELVNEKNDLFRKQTELMYMRRQQRLEQEQADIEHEIRVIQSRPAVNRIDADKAREEQLVSRLVELVQLRDELVQQLDGERRRERQEDLAIAASIASRRAQRNSSSNSSTMQSEQKVLVSPKKSKVRDKMKKQLKKAKHSLIPKKKDDQGDNKGDKSEKQKKVK